MSECETPATYALEAVGISKSFGGVQALRHINLKVKPGTIHCVVGENGAGKSTLMKIFSGAVARDDGEIRINGSPVDINDPKESRDHGVGIIYQEFVLAPHMTVAENVFLDDLDAGKFFISWPRLNRETAKIIRDFGFDIAPTAIVGDLSVAFMQIVEITKALAKNVRILILDEPTAVLAEPEINVLFGILRRLKAAGVTIIYISHRLEEIFKIADEITVMKDGESIMTVPRETMTKSALIEAMIGRELKDLFPPRKATVGDEILRVEGLSQKSVIEKISLSVRRGEVVGIAGLVGSGRTEFAKAVFGMDRITEGEVFISGKKMRIRNPRDAVRNRLGLIPENRKDQGLVLNLSIASNMTMTNFKPVLIWRMFLNHRRERDVAESYRRRLRIKMSAPDAPASSLSGGNQQKIALAKWLHSNCEILIFDEPTRGVDVGAKQEIYHIINTLAESGNGIIVISSELTELIGLCDRTYVFSEGRVAGSLGREEMTEANIMHLAIPSRTHHGNSAVNVAAGE